MHSSRSRVGPAVVSIDCSAIADELRSLRVNGAVVPDVGAGWATTDSDSMRSSAGRNVDVDALGGEADALSTALRRELLSEERRAGGSMLSADDDVELRRERAESMERRTLSIVRAL